MKTVMKKMAAIVLVGATVLSLAACSKKNKALTAAEFTTKLEAEGFTVEDKGVDAETGATMTEATKDGVTADLGVFADKDAAKELFNQTKSTMEALAELSKQMGQEMKVSTSSNKITMEGGADGYSVIILADNTIVTVAAEPGTDENISAAKSALKALGY